MTILDQQISAQFGSAQETVQVLDMQSTARAGVVQVAAWHHGHHVEDCG